MKIANLENAGLQRATWIRDHAVVVDRTAIVSVVGTLDTVDRRAPVAAT